MISAAINRRYHDPSSADSAATSLSTNTTATRPCSTDSSDTLPAHAILSGRAAQGRPCSDPSDANQAKHQAGENS